MCCRRPPSEVCGGVGAPPLHPYRTHVSPTRFAQRSLDSLRLLFWTNDRSVTDHEITRRRCTAVALGIGGRCGGFCLDRGDTCRLVILGHYHRVVIAAD